ncbi:ABC-type Fe3+-siderophore transport system permease subunit [Streptomyces sp. MJP52]|nr:ABC-type Fe3+-siderophore transport system permease subunit [Streptomyces sp. MJP52]
MVIASRLPRMAAGLLVGAVLGMAGLALQAVSRNVLASPDTLAVNAGSYLALGVAAVTGVSLPLLASSGIAFVGGLAAAAVVLSLSGLGAGTVRLVLAGSALTLGLTAVTQALLLLFPEQTEGLYAWNQGSIAQNGFDGVVQMLPIAAVGLTGLLLTARRVDALSLGDDAARGLGVDVRATRVTVVVLASMLSAAAVTLAGPIGFVGLCAPALVRPLARRVRAFTRLRAAVPLAGLTGAALVLGSDVALRAVVPGDLSVAVPTGVVTSLVGAVFLVVTATRLRDTAESAAPDRLRPRGRRVFVTVLAVLAVLLVGVVVAAVLLGDTKLLLGDVANWAQGRAGRAVSFVLDTRVPRVGTALLAGGSLALAGTLVQAVTRNPLAEPAVLGVSNGAALGAVLLVTSVPLAGSWSVAGAAFAGAAAASVVVFGLAAKGGFRQNRLVLVGMGVATAATSLISLIIVLTDPYNATKALTWLSGSTYGRHLPGPGAAGRRAGPGRRRGRRPAHGAGPGLAGRGHAPAAGHRPLPRTPGAAGAERAAERDGGGGGGHHRLRRPGRPARRPRPGRPPPRPRRAGRRPARRGAGLRRRPPRPHGHRPRPAGRRPDDRADRHAVLPVAAGAQPGGPGLRLSGRSRRRPEGGRVASGACVASRGGRGRPGGPGGAPPGAGAGAAGGLRGGHELALPRPAGVGTGAGRPPRGHVRRIPLSSVPSFSSLPRRPSRRTGRSSVSRVPPSAHAPRTSNGPMTARASK